MRKHYRHKFYLILLGLIMLFNACASKPKIKTIVPVKKQLDEKATTKKSVSETKTKTVPVKTTPPQKAISSEKIKTVGKDDALEEEDDEDKYIVLNFENTDLEIVLQTISELIGMNYILGPRVKGKITIQTYNKIPREDLPDVLHSILAINGFTTVKSGHYYKIISTSTAKQHPIETRIGKDLDIREEDVMVTQVIPLEHIAVSDASRIVKPLVSKGGNIITHKDTNLLIINELSSNLKRLFKIINLVDVPTESTSGEKVFVYYVENGDASKLASTLNSIYKKKKSKKKTAPKTAAAKVLDKVKKRKAKRTKSKTTKSTESELEGEITIVADTEINALIIKTTPRDYKLILSLLTKLDILPRQVLIEVLIANVTLDDTTSFGLEVAAKGQWSSGSSANQMGGFTGTSTGITLPSTGTTSFGSPGLSYLVEKTNFLKAMINLQASKENVEILSTPHILTADNKEASINIVDQEPITKTNTTSTGVVTQSFEYKDAGIKLVVKPKINDKGLVALDVKLEVSEVKSGAGGASPSFTKRDVKTSLVVQDQQTLVIGGLIKDKHTLTKTGIPWLMDIPYLGYLFGTTTDAIIKTELVMLITPRVLGSLQDAREITSEFERDVKRIKKVVKEKVD